MSKHPSPKTKAKNKKAKYPQQDLPFVCMQVHFQDCAVLADAIKRATETLSRILSDDGRMDPRRASIAMFSHVLAAKLLMKSVKHRVAQIVQAKSFVEAARHTKLTAEKVSLVARALKEIEVAVAKELENYHENSVAKVQPGLHQEAQQ
jgi:hypothetical protein